MADDPEDARHGVHDFDAIVAGWQRDGDVPTWPDEPAAEVPDDDADDAATEQPAPEPPAVHRPPTGPAEPADDHFVPPEPPPLPRLGPPAAVGLGLLTLGLVLVTTPGWVGVSSVYGLPLGLLTLAAGLGWLVLRLWPTPPDDGDDDGAQV